MKYWKNHHCIKKASWNKLAILPANKSHLSTGIYCSFIPTVSKRVVQISYLFAARKWHTTFLCTRGWTIEVEVFFPVIVILGPTAFELFREMTTMRMTTTIMTVMMKVMMVVMMMMVMMMVLMMAIHAVKPSYLYRTDMAGGRTIPTLMGYALSWKPNFCEL